jgi:hypothetical protein
VPSAQQLQKHWQHFNHVWLRATQQPLEERTRKRRRFEPTGAQ